MLQRKIIYFTLALLMTVFYLFFVLANNELTKVQQQRQIKNLQNSNDSLIEKNFQLESELRRYEESFKFYGKKYSKTQK